MKKKMKFTLGVISLFSLMLVGSCATIPKNVEGVNDFSKEKYLGMWYEIARFDFKFEKHLIHTSAQYTLKSNGDIKVLNQGYDTLHKKWKQAIGKAKFVGTDQAANLKVSFFGPFYGGYHVIALDSNYQYALVAGSNLNYLWILARTKSIPENVKTDFLTKAKENGFDVSKLIWVKHD